ncbi:MAG: MBL fold metallo-hydrolase [Armatimonadota bacterium]
MTTLVDMLERLEPQSGQAGICSLAQAGFLIKTAAGTMVAIDPYLTDSVERLAGFPRLVPAPITPAELDVDILAVTHNHPDHLDPDALPAIRKHLRTFFVAAPDCEAALRELGIGEDRYAILREGESIRLRDVTVRATYADHGDLAPEAVGFLITAGSVTVYNVGDSGFAPERMLSGLPALDVMIAPINGAYGNLNEEEAVRLAVLAKPRMLIGCHTGMFAVHGGDPERFLALAKEQGINALVMQPGDCRLFAAEVQP